jgi:hypothetical protein
MFSHTSPSFFLNLEWKNRLVPNPRVKCSVSSEVSSMDSHKLRNFFRMSFDTLCKSFYGSHTLSEVCVICFRLVLAERIWTFCLSSAVVSLYLRLYLLNFSRILARTSCLQITLFELFYLLPSIGKRFYSDKCISNRLCASFNYLLNQPFTVSTIGVLYLWPNQPSAKNTTASIILI